MADQDDAQISGEADELQQKIQEAKAANERMSGEAEEIALLKQQKADAEDKAMRVMADFQNARKRMEEEKASFVTFANQSLILRVLDIYDNYHRLMTHKPADLKTDEWHKGLDLIDQQFKSFLDQQGVKQIAAIVGDQIDPNKQEAVMSREGNDGEILEVFSPGYELAGRVIKTAKVVVGKKA